MRPVPWQPEVVSAPSWFFPARSPARPKRDEIVLAVWPDDPHSAVIVRYCCPPDGNADLAVWRQAMSSEPRGSEPGTMDTPMAWRHLTRSEVQTELSGDLVIEVERRRLGIPLDTPIY